MWFPSTAREVHDRLASGDLMEGASLDGKRQLDANPEMAVDIAAMTVNGGVLLFGADENEHGTRLVHATPIELAGQAERVAQIASTGISEPPIIDARAAARRRSWVWFSGRPRSAVAAGTTPDHASRPLSGALLHPRRNGQPGTHRGRDRGALRAPRPLGA